MITQAFLLGSSILSAGQAKHNTVDLRTTTVVRVNFDGQGGGSSSGGGGDDQTGPPFPDNRRKPGDGQGGGSSSGGGNDDGSAGGSSGDENPDGPGPETR